MLHGFRLVEQGASSDRRVPAHRGRLLSQTLGLELGIGENQLRFFLGDALIPESRELIARLDGLPADRERRLSEEVAARLAVEQQAAAALARAAALEERLARLEAERSKG